MINQCFESFFPPAKSIILIPSSSFVFVSFLAWASGQSAQEFKTHMRKALKKYTISLEKKGKNYLETHIRP